MGSDGKHYLNCSSGWKSWLFTLDHKRIGLMYLWGVIGAFFFGGLVAVLMRIELMFPHQVLFTADQYNQLFTLHGAAMVFMFIIPSIPAAIGNFILPLQLGAADVAFPKLNLTSFYFWIFGSLFAVLAIFLGGVDTGWTFYTPYSIEAGGGALYMALAAFILGFSSILTGVNFIATVHMLRAPGMGWFKMPLMTWALYATAIIQVLATPVVGITLLLLLVERLLGVGIFNPALGGDPVLFQHFFWFYSHPAVYIMVLPAMGIMSELVTTFCKRDIFGYKMIAYSSIAIAVISFLVWGHHMFVNQSEFAVMIFSLLTFLVAIPSGIKVFNWIATMYHGKISFQSPFLYFLIFLFNFSIGGFTGVMLGALSLDIHFHDTYFVVAHFHYTMIGGTVFAFIGGLHYWWPKLSGKMYNEKLARIAAVLLVVGFNVVFFTQFILGAKGMPRRYYSYLEQFQPLHFISTTGTWIMTAAFLIMIYYFYKSWTVGEQAPDNPWGGTTLEWQTKSPPIHHNFEKIPTVVNGPYHHER